MIAKIRDNWLTILLTVVVIISLILSGIVWVNPYRTDHRFFGDSTTTNSRQITTQSMRDIYLPTEVIKTDGDQGQHLLYGQERNVVLTARQSMDHWRLHRLTRIAAERPNNYLNYLRRNNTVMLSYPDSVPLTIFNDSFNQTLNYNNLGRINHIVIPLDSNRINHIYLLSDDNYRVFDVRVDNANTKAIKRSLKGGSSISVDHKIYDGHPMVTYPHGVKLPNFGDRISKLNPDSVSQTLMNNNSSHSSSVTSERQNNNIVYQSGTSRRLTLNPSKNTMDYENYTGHSDNFNYQQIFGHLYNQLAGTMIPLDSLRYDSYNSKNQSITYRSFVEGFPIFNDNDYGTVLIQNNHDGAERYHFTLFSLQVPVPVSKKKTTLPSSAVVFNGLRNSGKSQEIKGMRIGYQWSADQTDKTVTLTPTYYLKYHGSWVNYQDLIN